VLRASSAFSITKPAKRCTDPLHFTGARRQGRAHLAQCLPRARQVVERRRELARCAELDRLTAPSLRLRSAMNVPAPRTFAGRAKQRWKARQESLSVAVVLPCARIRLASSSCPRLRSAASRRSRSFSDSRWWRRERFHFFAQPRRSKLSGFVALRERSRVRSRLRNSRQGHSSAGTESLKQGGAFERPQRWSKGRCRDHGVCRDRLVLRWDSLVDELYAPAVASLHEATILRPRRVRPLAWPDIASNSISWA